MSTGAVVRGPALFFSFFLLTDLLRQLFFFPFNYIIVIAIESR